MKLHVQVTQEDIHHGVRFDCRQCPVARAVERALSLIPDERSTRCTVNSTSVQLSTGSRLAVLPLKAKDFIYRFDNGKRCSSKPFEFDLLFE